MNSIKKISSITAIVALFLTFSISTAFAQVDTTQQQKVEPQTVTVEGTVVDWTTEDALEGAQVLVVGFKDLTTLTDAEGKFTIESLAAGTYTIKVKLDGYQTWEKEVAVKADKKLEIKLKPAMK